MTINIFKVNSFGLSIYGALLLLLLLLSPLAQLHDLVMSFTCDGVRRTDSIYANLNRWTSDLAQIHGCLNIEQIRDRLLAWHPQRYKWDMKDIGAMTYFTCTNSLLSIRSCVLTSRRDVFPVPCTGLWPCCFTFGVLLETKLLPRMIHVGTRWRFARRAN